MATRNRMSGMLTVDGDAARVTIGRRGVSARVPLREVNIPPYLMVSCSATLMDSQPDGSPDRRAMVLARAAGRGVANIATFGLSPMCNYCHRAVLVGQAW